MIDKEYPFSNILYTFCLFFTDKIDVDDSHGDELKPKKRPTKRSFDSPPSSVQMTQDDQMHSPVSLSSSELNSVVSSLYSPKPNHVDTLRYIFPFYSERTLKLTLEECNDNILQAVLQISQDLLSFRVPFIESDNLGRIRSLATLFSSNIEKSSNGRPDCCESPYCPKQMAYDWARQRTTPRHPMPDLIEPKFLEEEYHGQNFTSKHLTEKCPRFNSVHQGMTNNDSSHQQFLNRSCFNGHA